MVVRTDVVRDGRFVICWLRGVLGAMKLQRRNILWHLLWSIIVHMSDAHKDHCVHVHPRPDEVSEKLPNLRCNF